MTRPASETLLPDVLRRAAGPGTPLGAVCAAMETLLAPVEATLDGVDAWFDPYRAPDRFVPYLAMWVGLGHLLTVGPDGEPAFAAGTGRLRVLVAHAALWAQTRGTPAGLVHTLALATGVDGFTVEEALWDRGGRPRFHLVVHLPAGAEPWRDLVARIVAADRPAHMTYEIAAPRDPLPAPEGASPLPPPAGPPPNPPLD